MPVEALEDLFPLLIFVLIPLIQWIRQFLAEQRRSAAPPATLEPLPRPLPPAPVAPRVETPRPTVPMTARRLPGVARPMPGARRPLPPDVRPAPVPPVEGSTVPKPRPAVATQAHLARPLSPYAQLLRNRTTLKRSIVLMTILGPSRALSPYGAQDPR